MTGVSPGGLRLPTAGVTDAMLEKALDFGADYYDLDLRRTISTQSRRSNRRHLGEAASRLTREELFFALVIAALHQIERRLVVVLASDIRAYHRSGTVGDQVLRSFHDRLQQLAMGTQDYWEWVSSERRSLAGPA